MSAPIFFAEAQYSFVIRREQSKRQPKRSCEFGHDRLQHQIWNTKIDKSFGLRNPRLKSNDNYHVIRRHNLGKLRIAFDGFQPGLYVYNLAPGFLKRLQRFIHQSGHNGLFNIGQFACFRGWSSHTAKQTVYNGKTMDGLISINALPDNGRISKMLITLGFGMERINSS